MAVIIFEGPDGGGKSTLINRVAKMLTNRKVITSEGPEKHKGEINERIRRYHGMYYEAENENWVFDRHPCVSQGIYGLIHDQDPPLPVLVDELYRMNPIFIYCRPISEKPDHTATAEWDTPEYLANVDANYGKLLAEYDRWAVERANIIYRIGDDMTVIGDLIRTLTWERNIGYADNV